MTKSQFEVMFREEVLPHVAERYEQDGIPDKPARREAWNDTVDSYIRDRVLPQSAANWAHPRWLETWRPSQRGRGQRDYARLKRKSPAQLDREISHALAKKPSPSISAHARRKKIDAREARRLLEADGVDFRQDFHQLPSYEVQRLADMAKATGYKKRKDAPGSTVRMFYQYLSRLK